MRAFLEAQHVEFRVAENAAKLENTELAKRAAAVTVKVPWYPGFHLACRTGYSRRNSVARDLTPLLQQGTVIGVEQVGCFPNNPQSLAHLGIFRALHGVEGPAMPVQNIRGAGCDHADAT